MSKHKHTPGPWMIERYADGLIQIVGNVRVVSDDEEYVTTVVEALNPDDEADAHLIAAAPELLEALQGMLEVYGGQYNDDCLPKSSSELDLIQQARAAIAKATA
ncbi:TPA: hypothetical protein NIA64_003513 [Pseudomonas aeruginosa]|nr:hypothetical protein [Pseudomonas aeruginosa]